MNNKKYADNPKEFVETYTLDKNGNRHKTGKLLKRGTMADAGEYIVGVNNWIFNKDGKFLVQQRSKNKKDNPSKWSSTNGLVDRGEDSIDTVIRETKEELGLNITKKDIYFITNRVAGPSLIVDIFITIVDFDLENIIVQEEEVDDIKLVNSDELLKLDISTTCSYIRELLPNILEKECEVN